MVIIKAVFLKEDAVHHIITITVVAMMVMVMVL